MKISFLELVTIVRTEGLCWLRQVVRSPRSPSMMLPGSGPVLYCDLSEEMSEPNSGLSFCRIQPQVKGRFDVITATNVSRTAQVAACLGPVMGLYIRQVLANHKPGSTSDVKKQWQQRTWSIKMDRSRPATITKMPPENMTTRPAFLARAIWAPKSMGIGIIIR